MTAAAGTSAHVGAARVTTSVPRDAHVGAADVTALTDACAHVGAAIEPRFVAQAMFWGIFTAPKVGALLLAAN
jgi:hypothetical protein